MKRYIATIITATLVTLLSYTFGYYNAVNDTLLFVKTLSANEHINTIHSLKKRNYEEAYNYQIMNLKENIAVIEDISSNRSKFHKIPTRYMAYRGFLSIHFEREIEAIKTKFDHITHNGEHSDDAGDTSSIQYN